jgi:hypothetical protein
MAEQLPKPADLIKNTLEPLTNLGEESVDSITDQIPDVPNPSDLVPNVPNPADLVPNVPNPADLAPEIPKIPAIGGLIGLLPLPQFQKPKPVPVPPPPQPKKLQKESAIPKVPKEPEIKIPSEPNPEGIPDEYRRVFGGSLFDEVESRGEVAYAKDVGFGQVEVYRIGEVYGVDGVSKGIAGPYRTSQSAKF